MQKLGADLACQSETYSPDHPFVGWLSCVGENEEDKFALLWGEAQLCLPYVCLQKTRPCLALLGLTGPKATYSYPKVTLR